ncbi:hypothetical protein [Streptomyces parvulus]|uniref:hypothetical protein n=1 Tax=Streptomyces parvulus TaxID=146923 RepID=UPI003799A83B
MPNADRDEELLLAHLAGGVAEVQESEGPKLTVLSLEVVSDSLPAGRSVAVDLKGVAEGCDQAG